MTESESVGVYVALRHDGTLRWKRTRVALEQYIAASEFMWATQPMFLQMSRDEYQQFVKVYESHQV